jgi:hypothetical protein
MVVVGGGRRPGPRDRRRKVPRGWERSQTTAHYWHIMRSGAASAPDGRPAGGGGRPGQGPLRSLPSLTGPERRGTRDPPGLPRTGVRSGGTTAGAEVGVRYDGRTPRGAAVLVGPGLQPLGPASAVERAAPVGLAEPGPQQRAVVRGRPDGRAFTGNPGHRPGDHGTALRGRVRRDLGDGMAAALLHRARRAEPPLSGGAPRDPDGSAPTQRGCPSWWKHGWSASTPRALLF